MSNESRSVDVAREKSQKSTFREYVEAIIIAVVLALFIRTFVVQAFKIPSGSMEDTLLIGDHILVNKFIYGTKIPFTKVKVLPIEDPELGDVIVFVYPEDRTKDFIKRVVGVPGDTVEVVDKQVFINGKAVDEPYAVHKDNSVLPRGSNQKRDNYGPVTVPESSVFVMGDNRDKSYDSRYWGFVDQDDIKGRALIIYWSWNGDDSWVRWDRIGHIIE